MRDNHWAHAGIRTRTVPGCVRDAADGRGRVVSGIAGLNLDNTLVGLPFAGTGF